MAHTESLGLLSLDQTPPVLVSQRHTIPRKPVPGLAIREAKHTSDTAPMAPKSSAYRSSRGPSFFQVWWLVIACCFIAVSTIFAIVFVLYSTQNRPLPTLPYHISVNTLISIFVIIMKGCMLLVLAEGLGQLKWEYFRKRRPLHHLVAYDSATRGPWGCVELILTLRHRSLVAVLGALVTILILPIEAFTQQLILYYPCSIPATNGSLATIPRASFYTETAGPVGSGIFGATTNQIGAMVGAMFNPESVKLPFVCSTGQCNFTSPYATLAFSADCRDVTDELRIFRSNPNNQSSSRSSLQGNLTSTLPSGLSAIGSVGKPIFSMSTTWNDPRTTALIVEMILGVQDFEGIDSGFRAIYGKLYGSGCDSEWQNQTWGCIGKGAARCTITPSVKLYNASIDAGILHERLLETYSDWYIGRQLQGPSQTYSAMVDLSCVNATTKDILKQRGFNVSTSRFIPYDVVTTASAYGDADSTAGQLSQILNNRSSSADRLSPQQMTLVPKTCIYEMPDFAWGSVYKFLGQYFTLQVTSPLIGMAPTRAGPLTGDSQALMILNKTQLNIATISRTFDALTQALSIRMRQWDSNITHDSNQAVIGTANVSTTCIAIQWAWITYAAVVVASTLIFFITVIVQTEVLEQTKFARGWVNSPLPLMLHGVDDITTDAVDVGDDKNDINVMKALAKQSTGHIIK